MAVPGGSISERIASTSVFCSSSGMTLIPKAMLAVSPGAPSASTVITAWEKYGGTASRTAAMRFSSSGPPVSVKRSESEICGQS